MNNKFIVRWRDTKGEHFKPYADEKTARKAKKWLEEKGATNVDITVRLPKKEKEDDN